MTFREIELAAKTDFSRVFVALSQVVANSRSCYQVLSHLVFLAFSMKAVNAWLMMLGVYLAV